MSFKKLPDGKGSEGGCVRTLGRKGEDCDRRGTGEEEVME